MLLDEILKNSKPNDVVYNGLENMQWYSRHRKTYNIDDNVLVFRGHTSWDVVAARIMADVGVLHHNGNTYTYCAKTKTAIGYVGNFTISDKTYNGNMILQDDDGDLMLQMTGILYKGNRQVKVQMIEMFSMRLYDAIRRYNDFLFLLADNHREPINNDEQVYVFKYVSSDTYDDDKALMFIYKDVKEMLEYITNNEDMIREKGTVIIPTTKNAWLKIHPETTVHKL